MVWAEIKIEMTEAIRYRRPIKDHLSAHVSAWRRTEELLAM